MNKIKEALEWFKEELVECKCSDTCPQCAAYEVAIEILEKAVKADEGDILWQSSQSYRLQ